MISGDPHEALSEWDRDWVELDTGRTLREGMFVAKVVGKSMEPRIPDGLVLSVCWPSDRIPPRPHGAGQVAG